MRMAPGLLLMGLLASLPPAGDAGMVYLSGTPAEIGGRWGRINGRAIAHDMDVYFLAKAAAGGISKETLVERSKEFVEIAGKVAPHWLDEARAAAGAAGVGEDLYIAFIAGVYRDLFMHECTSYAVSRGHAAVDSIFFHKNRDNAPKAQAAFIMTSTVPGVNKFIAVSDASAIGCMMMVNEKGLAGSADTGGLPVEEPRYRGMMNTFLLRHIAEKASNCEEALGIIRDFLKKGYYAGGHKFGTHWLFVDKEGKILEISNNTSELSHAYHAEKAYFSAREDSPAAARLRGAKEPVDFALFHSVSRDPSICLDSSISGMTVEIDPVRPETFTCAWITFPAHAASFPLLMGGRGTPSPLVNGDAGRLAGELRGLDDLWSSIEGNVHLSKTLLLERLSASWAQERRLAGDRLDEWTSGQAAMVMNVLRALNGDPASPPRGPLDRPARATARPTRAIRESGDARSRVKGTPGAETVTDARGF